MKLLSSFHASARGNSETAFGADASSRFLQMRPPETALRQPMKRIHHLDFFKCVRLRQLKDSLRSGRIFPGSLYASARDNSETAFRADASSPALYMRLPEAPQTQLLEWTQLPNHFIFVRRGTQLSSLSVRNPSHQH